MISLLIIGLIVYFVVSTYEPSVEPTITNPVIPIIAEAIAPVEKAPEPIYTPATNGETLLIKPTREPVSTFNLILS